MALELDEDLKLHRNHWIAQSVGRVVAALLVASALAGLLGPGPLSRSSKANQGSSASLEFERFIHYGAPAALGVRVSGDQPEVEIWISRDFVEKVELERVVPQPVSTRLVSDGTIFKIATGATRFSEIKFHFKPERPGSLIGKVRVAGGETMEFKQFAYP